MVSLTSFLPQAIGLGVDIVIIGPPNRGENTARWNRLLEVELQLKEDVKYRSVLWVLGPSASKQRQFCWCWKANELGGCTLTWTSHVPVLWKLPITRKLWRDAAEQLRWHHRTVPIKFFVSLARQDVDGYVSRGKGHVGRLPVYNVNFHCCWPQHLGIILMSSSRCLGSVLHWPGLERWTTCSTSVFQRCCCSGTVRKYLRCSLTLCNDPSVHIATTAKKCGCEILPTQFRSLSAKPRPPLAEPRLKNTNRFDENRTRWARSF